MRKQISRYVKAKYLLDMWAYWTDTFHILIYNAKESYKFIGESLQQNLGELTRFATEFGQVRYMCLRIASLSPNGGEARAHSRINNRTNYSDTRSPCVMVSKAHLS